MNTESRAALALLPRGRLKKSRSDYFVKCERDASNLIAFRETEKFLIKQIHTRARENSRSRGGGGGRETRGRAKIQVVEIDSRDKETARAPVLSSSRALVVLMEFIKIRAKCSPAGLVKPLSRERVFAALDTSREHRVVRPREYCAHR